MSDVDKTKICGYIYSVSCSIIAEILMIFGYNNNAWIVLYKSALSNQQFQRGLNDDCFKADTIRCLPWSSYSRNSSDFPEPFDVILSPNAVMYIVLYLARFLLISEFSWIALCIICCCSLSAERLARRHRRSLIQFCGLIALSFAILLVFLLTAYYSDAIMTPSLSFDQKKFGSGFWLFFGGGTCFYLLSVFFMYKQEILTYLSKQSHQPLPRHHEMATIPS